MLAIRSGNHARGDSVAIWARIQPTNVTIYTATSHRGSRRWSAPTALDTPGALRAPVIAVSPSGVAVATWLRYQSGGVFNGESSQVMAAVGSAQGRWGRPISLGSEYEPPQQQVGTFHAPGPRVAINGAGEAMVVWQHRLGSKVVVERAAKPARTTHWALPDPVWKDKRRRS